MNTVAVDAAVAVAGADIDTAVDSMKVVPVVELLSVPATAAGALVSAAVVACTVH